MARVLLVTAAAQRWKVEPATCRARQGVVVHEPTGRRVPYGELVDAAAHVPMPQDVALKRPEEFTLIGKPTNRLDSPQKVNGAVAHREGDAAKALAHAKHRVEAVYEQPFLAHATMEPMNCTVQVRRDGCEIWVGPQVPGLAEQAAQKATGLAAEKITVHNHLIGGGFGRRLEVDMIVPALEIGKQVDAPVKVFWTREEDIRHDMYRPYCYDRVSAGLDEKGSPIAWQHRIVGSSRHWRRL